MKKICLALLVVLFAGFASATELDAPSGIPGNVNWSFSVALNPTDGFDDVSVYVYGAKVVTAYPNGQVIVDPFNGQFVSKAFTFDKNPDNVSGLVLYVSYLSLPIGQHTVRAVTSDGGATVDDISASFEVYGALSESYGQELSRQVEALESVNSSLKSNIDTLNSSVSSISSDVKRVDELISKGLAKEEELNELKAAVEGLGANVETIDSSVKSLQEDTKSIEEVIDSQKKALEETNEKADIITGMVSVGSTGITFGLVVIAVFAVVLFIRKSGIKVDLSFLKSRMGKKETGQDMENAGKRWSYKDSGEKSGKEEDNNTLF